MPLPLEAILFQTATVPSQRLTQKMLAAAPFLAAIAPLYKQIPAWLPIFVDQTLLTINNFLEFNYATPNVV